MLTAAALAVLQSPQTSTPNGARPAPTAHASWVDPKTLVIDGDSSEWVAGRAPDVVIDREDQLIPLGRPVRELWTGPEDASLQLWVGWNETDLVLAGTVHDDVASYDPQRWFNGDSLELFLNLIDREARWGAGDYQVMLAPAWEERPWGVYSHAEQNGPSDGGFGGVEVSSTPMQGGYRFEARLPWQNFGGYAARARAKIGFNFAMCDNDGRGPLETYANWTGQSDIAFYADRRGELVLDLGPDDSHPSSGSTTVESPSQLRWLGLLVLALLYGIALWTRGLWRVRRIRNFALWTAALVLAASVGLAVAARFAQERERDTRRAEIEAYWDSFHRLLAGNALGHPEPDELDRIVQTLMSGKSISPIANAQFHALKPVDAEFGPEEHTVRRGIPFRPLTMTGARDQSDPLRGLTLAPGQSLTFALDAPLDVDAVHLVARVVDERYTRADSAKTKVLSIQLLRGGEAVIPAREVRNRLDLHYEGDRHSDNPGLEPAFYRAGGHNGTVHGDGLLFELAAPHAVDRVVVQHVGPDRSYSVQLVALSVRTSEAPTRTPEGLRANAAGEWEWSGWRADVDTEVTLLGHTSKRNDALQVTHSFGVGFDPTGSVFLRDTRPLARPGRWDYVPIGAASCLAPFLVALFAEWLSTRRRIRNKIGLGFAIASAVPLLALTSLLEASLEKEHAEFESDRVRTALLHAEQGLERDQRELEREAQRLLRIAVMRWQLTQDFPKSSDELAGPAWWGEGESGAIRVLLRVTPDGREVRVGTGPGWASLPKTFKPTASGLWRPWGKLEICGIAQTSSGAEQPMFVLVASEPRLGNAAQNNADSESASALADVELLGAGRDPRPSNTDIGDADSRDVRRAVFTPDGELAAVLVAARRERGVPVLADYTLTELLLAAGLSALFTAMLFAGILTGHLVGPIERLDRAVREGRGEDVQVEARDEVGHLAGAVRSFAEEVANRVRQLQTLKSAQEDLSSHLDFEVARDAVLEFFRAQTSSQSIWLLWRGEVGEEPRLYGTESRNFALATDAHFLERALVCGQLQDLVDERDLPSLSPNERLILGAVERVVTLPLVAGGECRGAIVLAVSRAATLDLTFLRAAAAQAAIALENARLYERAVSDAVTGFLFEPGFRQRLSEEIQRAEGQGNAGVLLVQVRMTELPPNDVVAAERMREAARRMRGALRGMAVFGRSGAADLLVALPWIDQRPNSDALANHIVERIASHSWPDGSSVAGLLTSHAAWPDDGPSARFVLHVLAERLAEVQSAQPAATLAFLDENLPPDFVAGAPLMVELLDTVRRVAEQDVTVVVSGETGTGKDRIAELVHRWSKRAAGSLVHIHCPSLSSSLIEDELFGHEVGAFTGASERRMGPFEFASGGTVVLDEVGGLSAEGQVALLRLVETRQVLPLGSTRPIALDVRLVATSSTDLASEVHAGRFRSDLYFRLNVAQVSIPPLRLRKQALPELVDAAVRRFNVSAPRPVTGVAPGVLDRLFEHDWPGNLRELFNVVSRGLILAQGGELRLEHIEIQPEVEAVDSSLVELNERQRSLLAGLAIGAGITSTEYADRHTISNRTGLRDLLDLVEAGYLSKEGQRRGTRFRRTDKPWRGSARQNPHTTVG